MSEDFGDGYKEYITEVPDFPKPGIGFKDISPLLADEQTFRSAIVDMGRCVDASYNCPDYWIGIDSRGFIFAAALATYFGGGVVCARKKGKLPGKTFCTNYKLEYGKNQLEIQKDMLKRNDKVAIIDDIFATSGTIQASIKLIKKTNANTLGIIILLELAFLNGRSKLKDKLVSLYSVST